MKVDDFGLFSSNTSLLKANLFPLALVETKDSDIEKWVKECVSARLILLYQAEGKKCLQIQNFKQRLDRAKSKYPLPPDISVNERERPLTNDNDYPEVDNARVLDSDIETDIYTDIETDADRIRKRFAPPSVDEVVLYFVESGYTEEAARTAYRYYSTANWKDSRGKQVKNWKQKMIAVWFKPENANQSAPQAGKKMQY